MPISDAEALVMEVLWREHPLGADEVLELSAQTGWAEPTVKTLLNRLLNKGAIQARKEGRRYLYTPVLAREDWVGQQSAGMLERLFGGGWRRWWRISANRGGCRRRTSPN